MNNVWFHLSMLLLIVYISSAVVVQCVCFVHPKSDALSIVDKM